MNELLEERITLYVKSKVLPPIEECHSLYNEIREEAPEILTLIEDPTFNYLYMIAPYYVTGTFLFIILATLGYFTQQMMVIGGITLFLIFSMTLKKHNDHKKRVFSLLKEHLSLREIKRLIAILKQGRLVDEETFISPK